VFVQDHEDEVNHYMDHHLNNADEYHMLHKVESLNLKRERFYIKQSEIIYFRFKRFRYN
jgi:hypothetical protein